MMKLKLLLMIDGIIMQVLVTKLLLFYFYNVFSGQNGDIDEMDVIDI